MNLIWHVAKTDLRRVALPAAVWLGLVALPAWWVLGLHVDEASVQAGDTVRWIGRIAGLAGGFTVIQAIAGLLLTGQVALEDPVTGSNSHWQTRPIAGGRLLTAKLVAAGLIFLVAPMVVLLPVWVAAGFGAGDCAVAAGEWVLRAGGGVMAAMALASVAKDFAQFAIAGLGALAALGVGISRWPAHWIGREAAFNGSPHLLLGAVVVPLVAVVLVLQYRTRRTGLGWALLGFVLAIATVARISWKMDCAPVEREVMGTVFQLPLHTGAEARAGAEKLRVAGFTLATPGAPQAVVVEERWRAEVLPLQAGAPRNREFYLRTGVGETRLRLVSTERASHGGLMLRVSQLVREDGDDWPDDAVLVCGAKENLEKTP